MYVAYSLIVSSLGKPTLLQRGLFFYEAPSGQLKFYDETGLQYVPKEKHSNLSVFDVNENIICIVKDGQFSKNDIYKTLVNYHYGKTIKDIVELKKIKNILYKSL